MKERILGYRKRIDALLEENAPDTPWEDVLTEHLVQVGFFQHERFVHLMVTLAFAIMGVAVILVTCFYFSIGMAVLSLLFVCLLFPYIMHYYLLENETQKMYKQYDKILEHVRQNRKKL
jgi:Flp pilus assembly protein TadB